MIDEIKPAAPGSGKLFEVPEIPKPMKLKRTRRDKGWPQRGLLRALRVAWCAFCEEMDKPPRKPRKARAE